MSSWGPPAAPVQEQPPPASSRARRSDAWAAFGRACAVSVALTAAVVVVGWIVLYRRLPPSNGSGDSMDGLVLVVWSLLAPILFGPLCLWAATTYCWRSLAGPGRPVRLATAGVLLLPAIATAYAVAAFGSLDRTDLESGVIVGCATLLAVVGTLLTGRVVPARVAAGLAAAIVVLGVAGVTFASASAEGRSERGVRDEVAGAVAPLT